MLLRIVKKNETVVDEETRIVRLNQFIEIAVSISIRVICGIKGSKLTGVG